MPQPLPKTGPGTLLKSERIAVSGLHGIAYRVMYLSESVTGKPVAVTGLVVVPDRPVPAGGYPVVTWGHGTDGMADQCAPSLDPTSAVPLANDLLDQGWEVTASDYQGEGTPGLLPYLVGVSAARNTIDIVRAARHLPAARASDNYVVWGHSEGGQTAMFALHIASSYAPDLHLKGVVAGAPPSQFYAIYQFLKTSPYRYYLFMAAGGFNAAYGDKAAPLDQVLTPLAVTLLPDLDKGCSDYVGQVTSKYTLSQLTKGGPDRHPHLEDADERQRPRYLHDRQAASPCSSSREGATSRSRWSPPPSWPTTSARWARTWNGGSTRARATPGSSPLRRTTWSTGSPTASRADPTPTPTRPPGCPASRPRPVPDPEPSAR